ncbi:unnamed protein product [Moneuplotes crassus]|uniref:Uncharacterized protein n=1 Tax=Euplotes crassus TaxID=5936 RepID=A0AAD1XKF2_EUPCR|nr:unnamed protein product [Moneuplotes crassus]
MKTAPNNIRCGKNNNCRRDHCCMICLFLSSIYTPNYKDYYDVRNPIKRLVNLCLIP